MGDLAWMVSGWDHRSHAFRAINTVTSEGICGHSALSSKLTAPTDQTRCLACVLITERLAAPEEGEDMAEDWRSL